MPLSAGTHLGPYEILALIGKGGMGEVYRAKDPKLGREVAIKVLPESFTTDSERLRRFEQEARATSALNHPNILTIFELGVHEGSPYLVMELLQGETLRAAMVAGPMTAERVAELGEQAAAGLAAAHDRGIVHRDLKPENLFITRDGVMKILDFGLARRSLIEGPDSTAETGMITAPGLVMGTLSYMSPEQAMGRPVDHRSDQFGLGVVLYELLSGKRPFSGESAAETLAAIVRDDPAPLESLSLGVPSAMAAIVAQCLAKEPSGRFASTRELARQLSLARLVAHSGEAATGRPPAKGSGRPPFKLRLILAASLVATAAMVVTLFLWRPWKPAPAGIPSVLALPAKVVGSQESAFLTDAIPDTLSTLLAGVAGLDTRVPPTSLQVEHVKGDLGKIAEAYRVGHLVLSTVTAQGETLVLDVKLAEAATRKVLWAGQFQGTRTTYTSMLQAAAQGLARALKPTGTGGVGEPVFRSEVELALREGRYFEHQYSRSKDAKDFERALAAFQRAQALEPSSALLAAEIASTFQHYYMGFRETRYRDECERWVARALELDPHCGRAWGVRCWLETNRPKTDLGTVFEYALKATQYAPNEAVSHIVLGSVSPTCAFQAAAGLRAMELDPLDTWGYSWAGLCLSQIGRKEEALAILERAIRVEPRPGFHTWLKYYCLFHAGRFEEAKLAYTEASWPEVSKLMRFLTLGDVQGGRTLAQEIVAKWRQSETGSMDWVNRVGFHGPLLIRLGLHEEALWLLDRSTASEFPPSFDFLLVDPDWVKLKGDPRYAKALASSRKYAQLFLDKADAAKARGEYPKQLEPALAELRDLVSRNP